MEGAAVAQVCYQQNVPCLVIRSLSDSANDNINHDFKKFYKIAARNAARFTIEVVTLMSKGNIYETNNKSYPVLNSLFFRRGYSNVNSKLVSS